MLSRLISHDFPRSKWLAALLMALLLCLALAPFVLPGIKALSVAAKVLVFVVLVAGLAGVMECAVIGIPDAHSGEAVKLVVVKKNPDLTEADVLAHCRQNLTGYKMPRVVEFRQELPKTPVGKVLRRELRDKP